jgi:hypothetical protein
MSEMVFGPGRILDDILPRDHSLGAWYDLDQEIEAFGKRKRRLQDISKDLKSRAKEQHRRATELSEQKIERARNDPRYVRQGRSNVYFRNRRFLQEPGEEYARQTVKELKGKPHSVYVRSRYWNPVLGGYTIPSEKAKTGYVEAYPGIRNTARNRVRARGIASHEAYHLLDLAGTNKPKKWIQESVAEAYRAHPHDKRWKELYRAPMRNIAYAERYSTKRGRQEGEADVYASRRTGTHPLKISGYPGVALYDPHFGRGYHEAGGAKPKAGIEGFFERGEARRHFKAQVQREKSRHPRTKEIRKYVGEHRTIEERERAARDARRWRNRAVAGAGLTGTAAGSLWATGYAPHAEQKAKYITVTPLVRNRKGNWRPPSKAQRLASEINEPLTHGSRLLQLPKYTGHAALGATAALGAGALGLQGVNRYHEHRMAQRRKENLARKKERRAVAKARKPPTEAEIQEILRHAHRGLDPVEHRILREAGRLSAGPPPGTIADLGAPFKRAGQRANAKVSRTVGHFTNAADQVARAAEAVQTHTPRVTAAAEHHIPAAARTVRRGTVYGLGGTGVLGAGLLSLGGYKAYRRRRRDKTLERYLDQVASGYHQEPQADRPKPVRKRNAVFVDKRKDPISSETYREHRNRLTGGALASGMAVGSQLGSGLILGPIREGIDAPSNLTALRERLREPNLPKGLRPERLPA